MSGLLGPDGKPISSVQFKKEPPPKLGEAFAPWAGRDVEFMTLPGGSLVQFDLSKLRLEDYRIMRDHYQVNASLAVLSFIQHQAEWRIECEDKKIADAAEEQLRDIWTPLNRALGTANWAGYSPNAFDWENNLQKGRVEITKVKDLYPEECTVHWDEVEGWAPPGRPRPKYKIYGGINYAPQKGWPIPVENCVHPDTMILCADLEWRRAGDLEIGQEIVAFDENDRAYGRRYKTAVIEVNNPLQKDCVTVETDIGDPITMSHDHPCLVRRGAQYGKGTVKEHRKDHWTWIKAGELQSGDRIGYFSAPWQQADDWEAGYIAGIVDGEGSLSNNGSSWNLSFSQRMGPVLERALDILDTYEFKYTVNSNSRDDCQHIVIQGGVREIMRFIGTFRPERIGRNTALYENVIARIGRSVDVAVVTSIESVGMTEIASIQTSSGTFITQGYLTHNSFWYPLLMENGDYYGRKLLRPAFQSWFFSILLHLFANRYFERFGEPTPVGRAPFDEQVTVDGQTLNGNQYLLKVIQQLRNRSAVVLPNDRTQTGNNGQTEFDYELEYLESQMRGADFERYLTRLDEEISLGLFTPILLLRTADVGSYNLGTGHMQVYQWMLNAMNADRALYINKYILRKFTNYNFSPNAPSPKIVFRKMGNTDNELIRQLLVELVKSGRTTVDLEELGELAGLSLKQVRQTLKPSTPPEEDGNADQNQGDGTENLVETKATVSEITARVRQQVETAFRQHRFNSSLRINMGYKRRFEKALVADGMSNAGILTDNFYGRMDNWLEDVVSIGQSEFSGVDAFMALFERVANIEVKELVR